MSRYVDDYNVMAPLLSRQRPYDDSEDAAMLGRAWWTWTVVRRTTYRGRPVAWEAVSTHWSRLAAARACDALQDGGVRE